MNLFQYKTYLHARVPGIYTPDGVKQVQVPWAREGSGFTLFFEALLLSLAQVTSVAQIHQLYDVSENRIWRVLEHYIEKEVDFQDFSEEPVTTLSIDEVAHKKRACLPDRLHGLRTSQGGPRCEASQRRTG